MAEPLNFRSAFNGFNREDVVNYIEYLKSNYNNQIRQLQADLAAAQKDNLLPESNQSHEDTQEQFQQQEALLTTLNAEKEELLSRCAALEAERDSLAEDNKTLYEMHVQLEEQLAATVKATPVPPSGETDKIAAMEDQFAQQEAVLTALNAEKDDLLSRCAALEADLAAMTDENKALTAKAAQLEAQLSAPAVSEAATGAYAAEELAAYRRAERVERMANERAAEIYRQLRVALQSTAAKADDAVASMDSISDQFSAQINALRNALSDSRSYLDQTISSLGDADSDMD